MLRGLYTAASGMTTQQRRHDTVTNNIANINTPGFKQTNSVARSFPEMLLAMTGVENADRTSIGRWTSGVFAEESLSIHIQGDLTQTNRSSDFAITSNLDGGDLVFDSTGKARAEDGTIVFQPQAFFTVQEPGGEIRYTRGGSFTVDPNGFLMTTGGSNVLGVNGNPIQLPAGVALDELVLTENWTFQDRTNNDIGVELLISRIEKPNELVREGNGNYRFADDNGQVFQIAANENVEVRQGYLERSNVDVAQASVDLMAALRAYEANQKVIQFYDQSLQKAANEVGRV